MSEQEKVYTLAEGRILTSRAECARKGHREAVMFVDPAVLTTWFPNVGPPTPPSGTRSWECMNCDGVVTVVYPEIGREVEAR